MADNETKDAKEEMNDNADETTLQTAETVEADAQPKSDSEEFEFVEEPVFEVDYKGDCLYEVKTTVPVANEQKLTGDVLEELQEKAELPGFRRGRAPKKLIERKFAKHVRSDVEVRLVDAAFQRLIKDKKMSPIGSPDVEGFEKDQERPEGEPLTFTLKFEVRPTVELGKYRGIKAERPVFKIEEKEITEALDGIRSRFAVYETLADGEAMEGDQAIISFKGTVDGEEFAGGAADNYPYILGSKRFFPEFEQAIVGKKAGETFATQVNFPADYSASNLAGKTADFSITLNELKRRNIPELTDEFAKQAGYESADDMREKVTARLREQANEESQEITSERVLKAVIDASTYELPKSMVESMARSSYEDNVNRLRQMRMPASLIEQQEPEMREEARKGAINSIKRWVTLQEIAETEGIEVTDEDFEKEAAVLASRTGSDIESVAAYLGNEEHRGNYEMRILRQKVLSTLTSYAEITDRELTAEEFNREAKAETEESATADKGE